MKTIALHEVLYSLLETGENEVIEFKEASKNYPVKEIYKYFSALSNEANLCGQNRAWLVFGVNDKTRQIVGTDFCPSHTQLQNLKQQVRQNTGSVSFIDIHELHIEQKRVLMFEIPPAPKGMPVFSNGHGYARAGESLKALDMRQLDLIRNQTISLDWSAQVIDEATMDHLDQAALKKARKDFIQKHKNSVSLEDIEKWSDEIFLGRLRLLRDQKLTRAAILLFGKREAWHLLSPHPAQLTWRLKGPEEAYEHFGLPFYLSSSELYSRIRNIQLRISPDDSLIPLELSKYDREVVMEGLHNCIMHQDYSRNSRIIVTEYLDRLELLSIGNFFEGVPDDYIEGKQTPLRYRNTCLAQAMTELNLVDSMGLGIARIFTVQAKRYFPLPDYDLSQDQVKLTIYGKVVDPAYSRLLIQKTDLPILDVLALDRVQKGLDIPKEMARHLRKRGLIEGRRPNLSISQSVSKMSFNEKKDDIRENEKDNSYYTDLILRYLKENGPSNRLALNEYLLPQFSESLNKKEKIRKISNIISNLRRSGYIVNQGSRTRSKWVLISKTVKN